jgi:gas vesicle protein
MSRESGNAGSNLVFFLLGAAVGAGVALLLAPHEGQETRRLIGEKAADAREKATEVSHTVAQTARETWETVTDRTRTLLHRGAAAEEEAGEGAAEAAPTIASHSSDGTVGA